mgnify:CR=1 FL=1
MKKRFSNKNSKSKKISAKTSSISTPTKEIKNKPFWALLTILFLSSFLTLTTITEDNSTLTGNAAIQVISYQPAGTDLFFEVRNVKNLKDATATFTDTIKNGKIIFKEPELRPTFDGVYLSAFTIESPDAAKIQQLIITLKIKESDIATTKLLPAELLVYHDNQPLPTTLSHSKDDYVYYTTTTTTMGTFTIGKAQLKLTKTEPPAPKQEITPPAIEQTTLPPEPALKPLPPIEQQPHPVLPSESQIEPQPITPETPSSPTVWQGIKNFFKNLF